MNFLNNHMKLFGIEISIEIYINIHDFDITLNRDFGINYVTRIEITFMYIRKLHINIYMMTFFRNMNHSYNKRYNLRK